MRCHQAPMPRISPSSGTMANISSDSTMAPSHRSSRAVAPPTKYLTRFEGVRRSIGSPAVPAAPGIPGGVHQGAAGPPSGHTDAVAGPEGVEPDASDAVAIGTALALRPLGV